MPVELQVLAATGETQYISKHNSNYAVIKAAIEALQGTLTASGGAASSAAYAFAAMFGPQDAIIGAESYAATLSVSDRRVDFANGYFWDASAGVVISILNYGSFPPYHDFTGTPAQERDLIVTSAGSWTFPVSSGALGTNGEIYRVTWDGSSITAVTLACNIVWGFSEWNDAKVSTLLGSFDTLDERLEAIESSLSGVVGTNQAANTVYAGPVSGAAATPTFRALVADDIAGLVGTVAALDLDTDGTLAANSDVKVATQKAVKTYADQLIAAADAMVFKGVIDCSADPNYPAGNRGETYRVSVAGKIGGASGVDVEAGDLLVCLTDSTAAGDHATVGAQWTIAQTNLDGGVVGPVSAVDGNIVVFNGPSGALVEDSGVAIADLLKVGIGVSKIGVPTASEVLLRYTLPVAIDFDNDFGALSTGGASAAATAQTDFDVKVNGVSVGTVSYAAAATVPTFVTSGGALSTAAGDVISYHAPATPDATLADPNFTLMGTRA